MDPGGLDLLVNTAGGPIPALARNLTDHGRNAAISSTPHGDPMRLVREAGTN